MGGFNCYPAEIEGALFEMPGVAQVAVLATPDETREEEVFACVVAVNESDRTETFARELFDLCFERLAYFKAPGWLTFVDDLPKTGSQKIQKHRIVGADGDPGPLLHVPLEGGGRVGDLLLDESFLDAGHHASALIDLLDQVRRFLLQLIGERLDEVRAGQRVDRIGYATLIGQDLLRTQRDSHGLFRRK